MARRTVHGARVIVTGASSGIGRELALQFASHQCKVVINARQEEKLKVLAGLISDAGGQAEIVAGDISSDSVRASLVNRCVERFGAIDILVNNAGIGAIGEFSQASPERLRRILEVNFIAPAELTRIAIPQLQRGTRPIIVNISSVLAHRAVPMKSEYCASKFALHGWSDAIRAELSSQGIDVLLVSPSTTSSEFFNNVIEDKSGNYRKLSMAQSTAYVARRTLQAIQRGSGEVILSWSGWSLVWLDRLFPRLADRLVARYF